MRSFTFLVFLLVASAGAGAGPKHAVPSAIDAVLDCLPGTYAYVVRDLEGGREWSRNADMVFPLASAAKTLVAAAVLREVTRGDLSLADRLEITSDLRSPPSGILQDFQPGLKPTVADLLGLLLARSDNTASDALLRRIGIDAVRSLVTDAGLEHTDFSISSRASFLLILGMGHALAGSGPAERAAAWANLSAVDRLAVVEAVEAEYRDLPYGDLWRRFVAAYGPALDPDRLGLVATLDNRSTARDMADLYTALARGELGDEATSELVLDLLSRHELFGGREEVRLPVGVVYAHKGGADAGIRTECGVMIDESGRAYVIVLFGQGFVEQPGDEPLAVDDGFLRIQEMLAGRLSEPPAAASATRPGPKQGSGVGSTSRGGP